MLARSIERWTGRTRPASDPAPWPTRYRGMLQILRFNWTQYATGFAACGAGVAAAAATPLPMPVRVACAVGTAAAGFWMASSLLVSHLVYDRSEMSRWEWVKDRLAFIPCVWANVHAGFDETTAALRRVLPTTAGWAVDIYDPIEMTEPSIARARRECTTVSTPGRYDRLPIPDGAVDTVFLLLAAHEIRRTESRRKFFAELRRVLAPGGQVLLVEHLRDPWGFLAFGPGFVHFHSRRTWLNAAREGGFELVNERAVTRFVRTFTLRRMP